MLCVDTGPWKASEPILEGMRRRGCLSPDVALGTSRPRSLVPGRVLRAPPASRGTVRSAIRPW